MKCKIIPIELLLGHHRQFMFTTPRPARRLVERLYEVTSPADDVLIKCKYKRKLFYTSY